MTVKKWITIAFLIVLSIIALYLSYVIFRPFIYPILTAFVIAIVFFPAHQQVQKVIKGPNLAALFSTSLVILIVVVPATLVVAALIGELKGLIVLVREGSSQSGGLTPYFNDLLDQASGLAKRYVNLPNLDLRELVGSRLNDLSSFLTTEASVLVGSVISFIVDATIAIFTLFFLFREGKSARRRLAALIPLNTEQIDKLFTGIENTIIGTVYGGLVVAAVQGMLIGLALWVFGIPSPVLWAVVAAFFALLPLVGTAAVWAPAAVYLLVTGHYAQALILVGWGAGIVGTMDNFLRPYLISGRVQMHTLVIFFAVFGGVSVFGFLGLFIGPVILAITTTLLGLLRDEARQYQSFWREEAEEALAGGPPLLATTDESK